MKETGLMTRLMARVPIHMLMELITMAIGLMISNMVSVWRAGQMAPNMKVNIETERKMGEESLRLQTEVIMMVNLNKMKSAGKVNTTGQMESFMRELGKTTKCTEWES